MTVRTHFVAALIVVVTGCAPPTMAAPGPRPTGPAVVMIVRHGEKPADRDPNLSPRGYERAAALARVIPARFPRPDFLFATRRSAHSDRPMETVAPLAQALHLEVDHRFKDDDFATLARTILTDPKYAGRTVLIVWHHGELPALAHALGATDAPDAWRDDVFDRVWKITYDKGVAAWQDLPEHALPGDSAK